MASWYLTIVKFFLSLNQSHTVFHSVGAVWSMEACNLLSEITNRDWLLCKQVVAGDTPYTSAKSFEELNLSESLLRGLYSEMKFERPSKIQGITLPMILSTPYHHLIAQAHNGSGKTTCFVLGMLSRVDPELKAPQAICVCPTRELAIQVCRCTLCIPICLPSIGA